MSSSGCQKDRFRPKAPPAGCNQHRISNPNVRHLLPLKNPGIFECMAYHEIYQCLPAGLGYAGIILNKWRGCDLAAKRVFFDNNGIESTPRRINAGRKGRLVPRPQ